MEKNELYSTIFKRKSIRKFDLTPLDDKVLEEISDYLHSLDPIYNDIKTEFKIVGTDRVKRRMMRKAPHYIAAFSELKDGYLTNIGFIMQHMDLFFSANGLGSCWQGIPAPTKDLLASSNLKFVIFLVFGRPKDPQLLHRKNITGFKRKFLREITDVSNADEIMETARLAPSATNRQPWFFTGTGSLIHAYAVNSGFLRSLVAKKYPPIDLGIALCHLKIAAEHFGKEAEIVFDEEARINASRGYNYIASLKME